MIALFLIAVLSFLLHVACAAHCSHCDIGGAGKCNDDGCHAGFDLDHGTKTCELCEFLQLVLSVSSIKCCNYLLQA